MRLADGRHVGVRDADLDARGGDPRRGLALRRTGATGSRRLEERDHREKEHSKTRKCLTHGVSFLPGTSRLPGFVPRSIRAKERGSVEAAVPSNGRRIRDLGEKWTATPVETLRPWGPRRAAPAWHPGTLRPEGGGRRAEGRARGADRSPIQLESAAANAWASARSRQTIDGRPDVPGWEQSVRCRRVPLRRRRAPSSPRPGCRPSPSPRRRATGLRARRRRRAARTSPRCAGSRNRRRPGPRPPGR